VRGFDLRHFLRTTYEAGPALLMPVFILSGIYLGWFSPTEAGGFACLYAIIVGRYVYRTMTWNGVLDCAVTSAMITAQILVIVAPLRLFSWILTINGVPQAITAGLKALELPPWGFLMVVNIILLVVGCFLDPTSAIIVLTPLFIPDREVARYRPDPFRHRDDGEHRDRHVHAAIRIESVRRADRARHSARHALSRRAAIRRGADHGPADHHLLAGADAGRASHFLEGRRTMLRILAIAPLLALTPQAQAQTVMKLASATVNDVQHEWQKVFVIELQKRVGDKVKTEIYPASQLGAIPRMVEGVLLGTIESFVTPTSFMVPTDPRFTIYDVPGLFTSPEHVVKVIHDPAYRDHSRPCLSTAASASSARSTIRRPWC
jgi:hypothetical protein